jgi:hypothetical protein
MKNPKTIRFVLLIQIYLAMLLFTGCYKKPNAWTFPQSPVNLPEIDKMNLNIELRLSDEFCNSSWYWNEQKIRYYAGEGFCANAEKIVRDLFTQVKVTKGQMDSAPPQADAVLTPKLISFERTRPATMNKEQITTVVLEWTLATPKGDLIWIDSVTGDGKAKWAIGIGKAITTLNPFPAFKRGTEEQFRLLHQDLFYKSFQAISKSIEIKEYVASH